MFTISLCHRVLSEMALNLNFRDVELIEKLAYSSVVAFMGFSLVLAILRIFSITNEAARVMVIAPLVAFVTTHIMFLNFYKLDYASCLTFWVDHVHAMSKEDVFDLTKVHGMIQK